MSTRANRTNRDRIVRLRVAEGVATAERFDVTETPVIEAPTADKPGRLLVQLIKAGWSQNDRYYSEQVLRRDGPAAFPTGTLNFIDHDTDDEAMARPAGSLSRLASVQTTPAKWDPQRKALTAEVRLFAPWKEAVTDWAASGAIGMSIRAWAEGKEGTVDGRQGMLVTALTEGRSVDYVTKPAAGGAIVGVLESITRRPTPVAEARNIGVWLESRLHLALTQLGDDMYGSGRLTREERIALSSAIGDALKAWTSRVEADAPQLFDRDLYDDPATGTAPADTSEAVNLAEAPAEEIRRAITSALRTTYANEGATYVWVRDFDSERGLVWYEQSAADDCRTWQEGYSIATTGRIALAGKRTQVVTRTVYDPVPASPGADAVVQTEAVTEDVTDGAPPTAPPHPPKEESMTAPLNTGTAPGAGGAAEPTRVALGEAERLSQLLAESRTALAEANAKADTATKRADEADAKVTLITAQRAAEKVVLEALGKSALTAPSYAPVVSRVCESLELGTDGKVDQAKLATAIEAEIAAEATRVAQLMEAYGVGRPRGLGASEDTTSTMTAAEAETELTALFGNLGLDEASAKLAAKGRAI